MKENITNLNIKMPMYQAEYCREILAKANIGQTDLFKAAIIEAAKQVNGSKSVLIEQKNYIC